MLNQQLEQMVDALPVIRQLFERDVFLTVIGADRVVRGVAVPDGEIPRVSVGEVFTDSTGVLEEVLRTGRARHNSLPKEVMGVALEGTLVPIKEDGKVVGCITCTYSIEVKEHMEKITAKFQEAMNNINHSIQSVVGGIEDLFQMLTGMNEMTGNVESDVQNAVEVVNKISRNASRSNILALNASIEATHSGEHGRGFAVVASEMGKLANDSGGSAKEIKATLNTITNHLASIVSSIRDANNVAKKHMESINAIQKILEEALLLSGKLEEDIQKK